MICCSGYFRPVLSYLPVRADPDGGTDHSLDDLAIHFFLAERSVYCHHLFVWIGQQREGKLVLFDELLVGGFGVW